MTKYLKTTLAAAILSLGFAGAAVAQPVTSSDDHRYVEPGQKFPKKPPSKFSFKPIDGYTVYKPAPAEGPVGNTGVVGTQPITRNGPKPVATKPRPNPVKPRPTRTVKTRPYTWPTRTVKRPVRPAPVKPLPHGPIYPMPEQPGYVMDKPTTKRNVRRPGVRKPGVRIVHRPNKPSVRIVHRPGRDYDRPVRIRDNRRPGVYHNKPRRHRAVGNSNRRNGRVYIAPPSPPHTEYCPPRRSNPRHRGSVTWGASWNIDAGFSLGL